MILTDTLLAEAAQIPLARARVWVDVMNDYLPQYGIITTNEVATFIAQIGHESQNFRRLEENLNYSVEGLANTWPSRFRGANLKPNALAYEIGRIAYKQHADRRRIANITYGNRMGNGDEASGDGYRYRGRSLIMLTGKNNYERFGKHLGIDLLDNPDLLKEKKYAILAACWFWVENNLDKVDHDISQLAETRIINGGLIGIRDRERKFSIAHSVINRSVYA